MFYLLRWCVHRQRDSSNASVHCGTTSTAHRWCFEKFSPEPTTPNCRIVQPLPSSQRKWLAFDLVKSKHEIPWNWLIFPVPIVTIPIGWWNSPEILISSLRRPTWIFGWLSTSWALRQLWAQPTAPFILGVFGDVFGEFWWLDPKVRGKWVIDIWWLVYYELLMMIQTKNIDDELWFVLICLLSNEWLMINELLINYDVLWVVGWWLIITACKILDMIIDD